MPDSVYSTDEFMDLLLASMSEQGITTLCLVNNNNYGIRDRRGAQAMYAAIEKAVEETSLSGRDREKDWFRFLVRCRNNLVPGHTGSFIELRSILVRKSTTIVGLRVPHDGTYFLEMSPPYARSILARGNPKMRELAEKLAGLFVAAQAAAA